jgi:hypothetical protein
MEAVRLTKGEEYSSVEKNDITNLIETLCEVTPDGTAEASTGLQALRREAARALFDISAADENDDRLTAILAALLSGSDTEAARQALVNRATGSSAVRLEAESALAFVEAVEKSTQVAPAHLVEELARPSRRRSAVLPCGRGLEMASGRRNAGGSSGRVW